MFTRVVSFTGATDVDGGLAFVREHVLPEIRQQAGYRGLTVSLNRADGVLGVLSMWESEAARDASDSAMGKAREEGQRVIGGEMRVETFEELVLEMAKVPDAGSRLLIRRFAVEPADVDANAEFFRSSVLPELRAAPGFEAVRMMVDRQTGSGIVGVVVSDDAALEAAAVAAEARRERAAAQGITLLELSKREVALVDLP